MHFPTDFIQHIRSNPGFNESAFMAAHNQPPSISVRYNPLKKTNYTCTHPVPWSQYGCYLNERPVFALDPLFHAGAYYVQEASSMFLETILRTIGADVEPKCILDLCASPGGKSTLIAATMHAQSVLFSNEVIKGRIQALKENLTKWGHPNVIITQNDATDYGALDAFFDIVVVDAPCSGSGMFRKDPGAIQEWSVNHVQHCSRRQQRIVQDIIPALKPGGWLIYATCSYSKEENEHIVAELVQGGWELLQAVPNFDGVFPSAYGYRFYPDKIQGEGFFIAALQKPEIEAHSTSNIPTGTQKFIPSKHQPDNWIATDLQMHYFEWRDQLFGFTDAICRVLPYAERLHLQHIGLHVGEYKHDTLIPHHALAMSTLVQPDIPRINLDLEMSLHYLRKNTISSPATETGWALIVYKNINLGWIKSIPGRINNYYPIEWRLRK